MFWLINFISIHSTFYLLLKDIHRINHDTRLLKLRQNARRTHLLQERQLRIHRTLYKTWFVSHIIYDLVKRLIHVGEVIELLVK